MTPTVDDPSFRGIIVEVGLFRRLGLGGMTVLPFIFLNPDHANDASTLLHEGIHLEQQRRWLIYGLGVGLLVWFALYLFALPCWKNPWRKKWETEAYAAQGVPLRRIPGMLAKAPYWLKE